MSGVFRHPSFIFINFMEVHEPYRAYDALRWTGFVGNLGLMPLLGVD